MERISPEPGMRSSDAERDEALRLLAGHYAEGRLDRAEFDRRAEAALAATTREALNELFADLPGRRPAARTVRAAARAVPATAPTARPEPRRPPFPPVALAVLLALALAAVLHGMPPFPLIALIFILGRRHRRPNRETRPWI